MGARATKSRAHAQQVNLQVVYVIEENGKLSKPLYGPPEEIAATDWPREITQADLDAALAAYHDLRKQDGHAAPEPPMANRAQRRTRKPAPKNSGTTK